MSVQTDDVQEKVSNIVSILKFQCWFSNFQKDSIHVGSIFVAISMPMIINIHRNNKRKSFTFLKTTDSPSEFTTLYYKPSSFYSLRENI